MPQIQLTLSKSMIADLDEIAEYGEVTRSETIRSLLTYALDKREQEDEPELEEVEP